MKPKPSAASHRLMSCQWLKMPGRTLINDEPGNVKPSIDFNWEKITMVAAAEQNPEMTGPDMKSISHPVQTRIFNYLYAQKLNFKRKTNRD